MLPTWHHYITFKESLDLLSVNIHHLVVDFRFGESSMNRIIKWIKNCPDIRKTSLFLDLGCGNGIFLVNLAQCGYTNLIGVDYSDGAINLARSIAVAEQVSIRFQTKELMMQSVSIQKMPRAAG